MSPNPLTLAVGPDGPIGDTEADVTAIAAMPRHLEMPLDAAEIEQELRAWLSPARVYRVTWAFSPPTPAAEAAGVPPKARAVLARFDERSRHYAVPALRGVRRPAREELRSGHDSGWCTAFSMAYPDQNSLTRPSWPSTLSCAERSLRSPRNVVGGPLGLCASRRTRK